MTQPPNRKASDLLRRDGKAFLSNQQISKRKSQPKARKQLKGRFSKLSAFVQTLGDSLHHPVGLAGTVLAIGVSISLLLILVEIDSPAKELARKRAELLASSENQALVSQDPFLHAPSYPLPFFGSFQLTGIPKINQFANELPQVLPSFGGASGSQLLGYTAEDEVLTYTLDPTLQQHADDLLDGLNSTLSVVALMDVKDGRILAISGASKLISVPWLHSQYPAASLIKIVSSAAALGEGTASANTKLRFRGGTYTLNKYNYLPDKRRDARVMTLSEALAKSCNPAFARLATEHIDAHTLREYASRFGFDHNLQFDLPLAKSRAIIPNDTYKLTRTAAGFGDVTLSPIHALSIAAMIGNNGEIARPSLIESAETASGNQIYQRQAKVLEPSIDPETARSLLKMLEKTTTIGTSRKEFYRAGKNVMGDIRVAGKTGTLRGKSVQGIHNWFIGVAPISKPEVAVATLIVYPNHINTRASRLARKMLEKYFSEG